MISKKTLQHVRTIAGSVESSLAMLPGLHMAVSYVQEKQFNQFGAFLVTGKRDSCEALRGCVSSTLCLL